LREGAGIADTVSLNDLRIKAFLAIIIAENLCGGLKRLDAGRWAD
jgi:hypothetical protein